MIIHDHFPSHSFAYDPLQNWMFEEKQKHLFPLTFIQKETFLFQNRFFFSFVQSQSMYILLALKRSLLHILLNINRLQMI